MADPKLEYLGSKSKPSTRRRLRVRKVPIGLLLCVVLPTALAAIYFLLIASPRYVSEAHFVVRSAGTSQPSPMGLALNVAGISTSTNEAFAVHEYLTSRDSLRELQKEYNVRAILGRQGSDFLARYPRPWDGSSEESLFKAYLRFLDVGHDSSTGISTIRVQAFTPKDAYMLNEALLKSGEALVNKLNERAAANALSDAERDRAVAAKAAEEASDALTRFRTSVRFIDPRTEAAENTQIIATLSVALAQLRAERDQIQAEAPASPQLAPINRRIIGLETQVEQARIKMAGSADSLAPKVGTYEDLLLQREIAERRVTQAEASLIAAQQEASRQKLYLERIVSPSMPDKGLEPRRWRSLLTVFLSVLLAYGVGWLVWAGIREHRQD